MTHAVRYPIVELRHLPAPNEVSEHERLQALVEALSAYIKYFHGGSVEVVDFDGETLMLKMAGPCAGYPPPPVTLHGWVAGTVKEFFPTVKSVLAA